jgi:hypothetical protein
MLFSILILSLLIFNISFAQESLTFAVLSYGDTVKEYKRYSVLSKYLSSKLNKKVDMVIVENVDRVFELFERKEARLAVGCSVVYFELKRKFNVEAVAVMKINGKAVENGVLVVKKTVQLNPLRCKRKRLPLAVLSV